MAINARQLRRRVKANEEFNVRAAAPATKKKVINDMVLEHAAWLQSLEVNMMSFRDRFGIEFEDCVLLEVICREDLTFTLKVSMLMSSGVLDFCPLHPQIVLFRRLKLTRVRIKLLTSEYRSLDFWALREAMRLMSLCVMGLAPLVVTNINGEKQPCSMSTIVLIFKAF